MQSHFNPLPPHGGRPPEENPTPCNNDYFNPLPPHGGRPIREKKEVRQQTISIHSLRMEGDRITLKVDCQESISIHSLRMEGDSSNATVGNYLIHISIHSLRMEGDSRKTLTIMYFVSFQSTPSAWRETTPRTYFRKRPLHFNPLPPHGGRHTHLPLSPMRMMYFNPLPPHGGRPLWSITFPSAIHFNPLPPHGGRLVLSMIQL